MKHSGLFQESKAQTHSLTSTNQLQDEVKPFLDYLNKEQNAIHLIKDQYFTIPVTIVLIDKINYLIACDDTIKL